MQQKHSLIYILIVLFISCTEINFSDSTIPTETENIEMQNPTASIKSEECNCYKGVGSSETDVPILTYSFTNGKSISICGYHIEDYKNYHVSEFNVFDCSTGSSLTEYDAMTHCEIKTRNDTVIIQLLENLPIGENWEWKLVQIAEQYITSSNYGLSISELKVNINALKIDSEKQIAFLKSIQSEQGFQGNWEDELGLLEVLSLTGNEEAWKILKNYEDFKGIQTDGAMAEQWYNAVATVEWLTEK